MLQNIFFPLIMQGRAAFTGGVENARATAGVGNIGIGVFIGYVVQGVLGILGIVFLIYILYGGFKWMAASGQDKQLQEAQKIITHSIVGLIIVVLAYAISTFVVGALQKAIT